MNINELYKSLMESEKDDQNLLFSALSERFRLFIEHRISDGSDADEVIQNALLVISSKYREVVIESSFAAWAHGVLQKELLRYYKKKGIYRKYFERSKPDEMAGTKIRSDPDLKRRLIVCFKKLCRTNQRYARVLNLTYQGFSSREISRRLKIKKNNLYVLLSRGRSLLKECLDKGK